jgi:hypothetical protein
MHHGILDARGCIPACWLAQYLFLFEVGNLLQYHVAVHYVRHYQNVLYRYQRAEPVHGHLYQTPAGAEKVKKLFGAVVTAERPEAAAYAAGHYYAIVIHNVFSFNLFVYVFVFISAIFQPLSSFYPSLFARKYNAIWANTKIFPQKYRHSSLYTSSFTCYLPPTLQQHILGDSYVILM